jgi:hypothetical protein
MLYKPLSLMTPPAFYGVADLAKLDREKQAEAVRTLWSGMTKVDVSIQQRRTELNPTT